MAVRVVLLAVRCGLIAVVVRIFKASLNAARSLHAQLRVDSGTPQGCCPYLKAFRGVSACGSMQKAGRPGTGKHHGTRALVGGDLRLQVPRGD